MNVCATVEACFPFPYRCMKDWLGRVYGKMLDFSEDTPQIRSNSCPRRTVGCIGGEEVV